MACTKFEYVKKFEIPQVLLPSTFIVVRIDGKGFSKFTTVHAFKKPNDIRGISLMNKAAEAVMNTFSEIWIAYGESDEFSFVFRKDATLFSRRCEKIISCVTSCFTAAYVFYFSDFFPGEKLKEIPMFDGRCVCYPDKKTLRDYLSWRQADTHINNLYNTCFWLLVKEDGKRPEEAEKILKVTDSAQKNELLFSKFNTNYNNIEAVYRKGSILLRKYKLKSKHQVPKENKENKGELSMDDMCLVGEEADLIQNIEKNHSGKAKKTEQNSSEKKARITKKGKKSNLEKQYVEVIHEDLIGDQFWSDNKEFLFLEDDN